MQRLSRSNSFTFSNGPRGLDTLLQWDGTSSESFEASFALQTLAYDGVVDSQTLDVESFEASFSFQSLSYDGIVDSQTLDVESFEASFSFQSLEYSTP